MKNNNRVALGTFPLADVFTKVTKNNAKDILRAFLDNGGYYIDTAPLYGFGEVEKLVGEVLKDYKRDEYYLCTKCGFVDVEGKTFQTVQKSGKYKDVIKECNRSLERLKLDYVDLYFVHSPDPNTPLEETREALEELRKRKLIKEIGVSNVDIEELREYNGNGSVKFVQNRFSLINRSINGDLLDYMLEKDIKLVPYQAIDRGLLSGKVFEGFKFRDADLRNGRPDWEQTSVNVISEWVKSQLAPIAKELNITIGQLAIAWALHQKYMGFVLLGTTNIEQMKVNLEADKVSLDKGIVQKIETDYENLVDQVKSKYGKTLREFRGLNEKYY